MIGGVHKDGVGKYIIQNGKLKENMTGLTNGLPGSAKTTPIKPISLNSMRTMKILLMLEIKILYINILTEIKMKLIQMGSGQAILDMPFIWKV